ncbi:hypothetical protein PoHVEF18_002728 [Penicillium ochrochloron]
MSISLANADHSERPSAIFLRSIHGPKWGYAIYRTNYDPALEAAWTHTLHTIRAHIFTSIEEELHEPLSWMHISAADRWRIRYDPSLCPLVDPAPVDAVKARMELVIHDDAERYDGLSVEDVRDSFYALCTGDPNAPSVVELFANPQILSVETRAGLPVSANVCLIVDGEVLRAISQDLRNEYGEGPFVKAIERLPCLGPDYEGWFKVALTYLWKLVMRAAANTEGLDLVLPPKRHTTGERPIWNGSWPIDLRLEAAGIYPEDMAEIEEAEARGE